MNKTQSKKLTLVLAGGGARGALQVGALRALLEAGIQPDLVVGTSAGAINAAFLGLYGFNPKALELLESSWFAAAKAELLPPNPAWVTMRLVFDRIRFRPDHRLRDFFIAQGLAPELRFGDLPGPSLIMVSTDLNSGKPVFFGADPTQSVLEGLLASTALPPWIHPLEVDNRYLVDGGSISNLPIEPAILHGATEIIALDLPTRDEINQEGRGFGAFWTKLLTTIGDRQIYLEMELAQAKGIPVHLVGLTTSPAVPVWDFSQTPILLGKGYEQMKAALKEGKIPSISQPSGWWDRMIHWASTRIPEFLSEVGKDSKARTGK